MRSSQIISLVVTILIMCGLALWLLGDRIPDITFFSKKDNVEKTVAKKTKRSTGGKVKGTGKVVDAFNGVKVYDNGSVRNVSGRNTTPDGYNLGLKYQCVEFVKRYYYERFGHKMPNSYGHAKEFFDHSLSDGSYNTGRNLRQYSNSGTTKPKKEDLLVYRAAPFNQFGHVAIVTKVTNTTVECISQNLGPGNGTRRKYAMLNQNGRWLIDEPYILGWLRRVD